jgi:glutamine synthetase
VSAVWKQDDYRTEKTVTLELSADDRAVLLRILAAARDSSAPWEVRAIDSAMDALDGK